MEIDHIRADGRDLPDEFMADRHGNRDGLLCPGIPVVDVHVRAADSGTVDTDENVVDAESGLGDVFEPQAGRGVRFDKCFHEGSRLLYYAALRISRGCAQPD